VNPIPEPDSPDAVPRLEDPRMIDFVQKKPTTHSDLELLGDEIAELAAHIHAAT